MNDVEELAQLIAVQIDQPALEVLQRLYDKGLVTQLDVEKFRVSIRRYKEAILSEHAALDIEVRRELVKSLLTDYQMTVNKLVNDIARRMPPAKYSTIAGQEAASSPKEAERPPKVVTPKSDVKDKQPSDEEDGSKESTNQTETKPDAERVRRFLPRWQKGK